MWCSRDLAPITGKKISPNNFLALDGVFTRPEFSSAFFTLFRTFEDPGNRLGGTDWMVYETHTFTNGFRAKKAKIVTNHKYYDFCEIFEGQKIELYYLKSLV
jgi:hypothetical protein